ncbi:MULTISPECIES: cell division protein FtsA [Pseudomonadaceae]|jgi:cell division protein FtsA|uniref:Cell division protein FtsA n=1 Tax=Halopseudomonas pachastrellae TaxID=254161 RepID=A0A1S8DEH0_9GAMM|nr:cell division protein FtsA [Halopseudomonas pachastrellae]MAG66234.1 cell division protein FtsA [Pseudomonadales bacterium]MAQ49335.1 cell division protein FtsA [Pseudomonas sp.]MED5492330.1 cell division protein FtsA [Pseudomonadota bacterium]MBB51128.1 cell division protein FtsA [Pseudomonadales bacterium]MEB3735065.1 cell division protein FtsA [Halopseudomonas pachastrellae]|tara:strand:+ start:21364 stop:22596 length:1233 start_codon:yes stop_codon:yes gene_type:complete
MASKQGSRMIVGLDIGTSKVVALVGEIGSDGELEIVGIGSHPSRGLKKGVVVNIESTVQSIQRAIEEAELMAGCQIHSVYAGIAGNHIRSLNSNGIVAIRDREVVQADIERVLDAGQAVAIPADQKVLHILPQEYVIDNQEGVREPLGMSGVRLEAKVHLVTCALNAVQNIEKCIRRCGLEVEDVILEQLASSYAVLTEDEKELGVCLVDVGGGTTDIAIFTEGAIRHTAVIPIAGDQVTNDIAMALRTPTQYAEEIKIRYACALAKLAGPEETIKVPSVGERPPRDLSRQALAEVVEPRYDELFTLIQAELRRSGFEDMIPAGIVLTGGTAKMEGAIELAEEIFHMPVRLGMPQEFKGLTDVVRNPIYATGVGLLHYGIKHHGEQSSQPTDSNKASVVERMKKWFQGNF